MQCVGGLTNSIMLVALFQKVRFYATMSQTIWQKYTKLDVKYIRVTMLINVCARHKEKG